MAVRDPARLGDRTVTEGRLLWVTGFPLSAAGKGRAGLLRYATPATRRRCW